MPEPIAKWESIDLTNGVVLPLFLMLTVGFVLAIYTGLVATRVFAFFQLRAKAVSWVFELRDVLIEDHETPHDFSMKLGHATQGIILEFRSLGHDKADALIGSIFSAYLEKTAQVCGVPVPPSGVPAFPTTVAHPLLWMDQFWAVREFYSGRLNADAAAISRVRPSIKAILSLHLFPDYITEKGKYRGMLVPRAGIKAREQSAPHPPQ